MSDHITIDGKKYYSEEYFQGSLASSKRRGERIAELEQKCAELQDKLNDMGRNAVIEIDKYRDKVKELEAENARLEEEVEQKRGAEQALKEINDD